MCIHNFDDKHPIRMGLEPIFEPQRDRMSHRGRPSARVAYSTDIDL